MEDIRHHPEIHGILIKTKVSILGKWVLKLRTLHQRILHKCLLTCRLYLYSSRKKDHTAFACWEWELQLSVRQIWETTIMTRGLRVCLYRLFLFISYSAGYRTQSLGHTLLLRSVFSTGPALERHIVLLMHFIKVLQLSQFLKNI